MTLLEVGTLRTHKDGEGFRGMQSGLAPALNARARQDGSQQGVVQINPSTESGGKQPYQQNRIYEAGGIAPALNAELSTGSVAVNVYGDRITRPEDGLASTLKARADSGRSSTHHQPCVMEVERAPIKYPGRNGKKVDGDYSFTVDTVNTGGVKVGPRIRRLTPIECERLQGCEDGHTKFGRYGDEIKEISDTQRYKGLGNSFTVNVIEAIISRMIEKGCLDAD